MNEETIYLVQSIKRFSKANALVVFFVASFLAISNMTMFGFFFGTSFGVVCLLIIFDIEKEIKKELLMQRYFQNKRPIKKIEW